MAESAIQGSGVTVQELFYHRTYRLDYYQREYTWSRESIKLLLSDLERRFTAQWDTSHQRERVARYEPYFLGPYVYYDDDDGITYLVDGQQRITTLHLILIHIRRLLLDQDMEEDAHDLEHLIYHRKYGRRSFTIDVEERHQLLDALLDGTAYELASNATTSVRNLYDRSHALDELFPASLMDDSLPHFRDWLLERVCLVGIKALGRENGWEIFESMNDRGQPLGPVDLLKSFLLSNVDATLRRQLDKKWREMLSRLDSLGLNTASDFVKAVLISRYIDPTADGERERIDRSFHEWARNNDQLELHRGAAAERFMNELFRLAPKYCMLVSACQQLDVDKRLHTLYYNTYNSIPYVLEIILAALDEGDHDGIVKDKANLIAGFLDILHARRIVNNDTSMRDDELQRSLISELRTTRRSEDIARLLATKVDDFDYDFSTMETFGLHANRREVRYVLARLTAYVETKCGGRNEIDTYLDSNHPYEIEHIWSTNHERYRGGVKSIPDFHSWRNRLGALLLLPKSMNASFRDLPYEKKLDHYRTQNRLAASLHPLSRQRNPQYMSFLRAEQLSDLFRPFPGDFGINAIKIRQQLYRALCERVWDPEAIGLPCRTKGPKTAIVGTRRPRKPRTHYGVEVMDLVDIGLIERKEPLLGRHRDVVYEAFITSDGRIRVATGEVFPSLSAAGVFVRGTKACPGWNFWHVRVGDGLVSLAEIRSQALANGLLQGK